MRTQKITKEEWEPTTLTLPLVLYGSNADRPVWVLDEVSGRPVMKAFGPDGATWLSFGPAALTANGDLQEHPGRPGTADVPALRLHSPHTGRVALEASVDTPEYNSGAQLVLYRQSGNEAIAMASCDAGGHLVILNGEPAAIGREQPAIEMSSFEGGGCILLVESGRPGGTMKFGFSG